MREATKFGAGLQRKEQSDLHVENTKEDQEDAELCRPTHKDTWV